MTKIKVNCPHCGAICKQGTGLATHIKQWCKKATGSQRYQGPGTPEPVKAVNTPDGPEPEPVPMTPEASIPDPDHNPPKVINPAPLPTPQGDRPEGRGDIAAAPPPPSVNPPEPDPNQAPPFDWKKNGPILVVIALGVICVIVGVYLWVRKSKTAQVPPPGFNQAIGQWANGEAAEGRYYGGHYMMPGGGL